MIDPLATPILTPTAAYQPKLTQARATARLAKNPIQLGAWNG